MKVGAKAIRALMESSSLGAPENAIGFVIWRVVTRYQREVDRALAALDLTHLQFETLIISAWLTREGQRVTQSDLSKFADIGPMQVSHMLKTLESKGMVERSPSPADGRAKYVDVTALGLKALRRALPITIAVQRQMFGEEGRPGGSFLAAMLRIDGAGNE